MAPLTICCLEVGDYLGHGRLYVETLANMCERHCPPHTFVCVSDREHCVETLPADPQLKGWWSKVSLFKPGRFTGNVLYFDLDVVISGDLDGLVELLEFGDFWALDDFAWPLSRAAETEALLSKHASGRALLRLLGGPGTCNSSVMLWREDAGRDIWEHYSLARISGLHGDQNWITQCMGDRLQLIPQGWARSYRYGGSGPITVHHGEPKPHEVADPAWH